MPQLIRRCFEKFHRGALGLRAGERVDCGEGPPNIRTDDSRIAGDFGAQRARLRRIKIDSVAFTIRQRAQKSERECHPGYERAEIRPILAVPRNNLVEAGEPLHHVIGMRDGQPVQPGGPDRPRPIRKPSERHILFRAPDFGVLPRQRESLKRGQAHDEIANGTGPDEKSP